MCLYIVIVNCRCVRPYHVENTGSRPITEVKQRRAWLVLRWVTAWEHHVLYTFFYPRNFRNFFMSVYCRCYFPLPAFTYAIRGSDTCFFFVCFLQDRRRKEKQRFHYNVFRVFFSEAKLAWDKTCFTDKIQTV